VIVVKRTGSVKTVLTVVIALVLLAVVAWRVIPAVLAVGDLKRRLEIENDARSFVVLYHEFAAKYGAGPKDLDDLMKFGSNRPNENFIGINDCPKTIEKIKDNQMEVVWLADFKNSDLPVGKCVLMFEKNTDSDEKLVAMADASIECMNDQEIDELPRIKTGKKKSLFRRLFE
jgi:hypothetical protein